MSYLTLVKPKGTPVHVITVIDHVRCKLPPHIRHHRVKGQARCDVMDRQGYVQGYWKLVKVKVQAHVSVSRVAHQDGSYVVVARILYVFLLPAKVVLISCVIVDLISLGLVVVSEVSVSR